VKNPRAFVVASAVALVAGLVQWRYVASREKALLWQSEPLATLVSLRDVPAHVRLDETMVEVREVPRQWRQPRALASVEDILGQITAAPVLEGEQVTGTKLIQANDAGLAYFVQKKHRAVTLAADEVSAVGGLLEPGNAVDVVGTFDFGQGDKSDVRTVTLFQDVRVLAVGSDIGRPTPVTLRQGAGLTLGKDPTGEALPPEADSAEPVRTVTVELPPGEAQKLVLAQELGQLSLTLRSLWEAERSVDLEPATIHSTLGVPEQVRYQPRPRYRLIQAGGY
jgi:pilus assembly protein CpaB